MGTEIQRTDSQTTAIARQNWQENYQALPVKSDTGPMQVLQMGTPALSTLGKDADGQRMGITVLDAQITSLLEFIGVKWTGAQISECAELAYTEYYYFTLAEVKQFFTRVKTGFYESHKNVNPAVFMGFMQQYADEMRHARYDHFSLLDKKKWDNKWLPPQERDPPEEPISDEKFNEVMQQMLSVLVIPPEPTFAEEVGGDEEFARLKEEALEKAKQLGVNIDNIKTNDQCTNIQ